MLYGTGRPRERGGPLFSALRCGYRSPPSRGATDHDVLPRPRIPEFRRAPQSVERRAIPARRRGRKGNRRTQARTGPLLLPGSAWRAARQDPGRRRGREADAKRRLHDDDAAREGHLASHGVSGVHAGRRLRDAGDAGRGRLPDDRRPVDLSGAALGAEYRLGAVRHVFPERQAGAVLHAASCAAISSRRCASPAST